MIAISIPKVSPVGCVAMRTNLKTERFFGDRNFDPENFVSWLHRESD
jgi:hypothetical protein